MSGVLAQITRGPIAEEEAIDVDRYVALSKHDLQVRLAGASHVDFQNLAIAQSRRVGDLLWESSASITG